MTKNTNLTGQPVLCQLLSFLPLEIVDGCVSEYESDRYYKTLTTYKQLVFILYGVVTKSHSLNSLCKNLLFLEDKLTYLGIDKLPAVSTLSDANINRNSDVFAAIYQRLYQHHQDTLNPVHCSFQEDEVDVSKVAVLILLPSLCLWTYLFKGAGRNSLSGKKKGGLKIHTKMPLSGFVPDLVHITEVACNDKSFLEQLESESEKGTIYVFDKGYVNYAKWAQWTQQGIYYVTRLNENADYQVLSGQPNHISEYADGGIISDQIILLNPVESALKACLIVYKDPHSARMLKFVSNMMDYPGTLPSSCFTNTGGTLRCCLSG